MGKKAIKIINLGPGGAFGELALITGTRRAMSVRVMENTVLGVLN